NRAVIWAMFNRYAFWLHDNHSNFWKFIRSYSTPLQSPLNHWGAAKRHAKSKDFVASGGNYAPPHDDIPKGQLRKFLDLQEKPWSQLPEGARNLVLAAMRGEVENPIGPATEFANTAVYYRDQHKRMPNEAEWSELTQSSKGG